MRCRRRAPLIERVLRWIEIEDSGYVTPCWIWTGYLDRKGYGRMSVTPLGEGPRRTRLAYGVAYEELVGPIPQGLELDHLCRVPACCNPDHLEPVTRLENWRRGRTPSRLAALRDRCVAGHCYTHENTYIRADGARVCRACNAAKNRAYRARKAVA